MKKMERKTNPTPNNNKQMEDNSQIIAKQSTLGSSNTTPKSNINHLPHHSKSLLFKKQPRKVTPAPCSCTNISIMYKGTQICLVSSPFPKADEKIMKSSYFATQVLCIFKDENEDLQQYNKLSKKNIVQKLQNVLQISLLATESSPYQYLIVTNKTFFKNLTIEEQKKPSVKEWLATEQILNELFNIVVQHNFTSISIMYPWKQFDTLLNKNIMRYLQQAVNLCLSTKPLQKVVVVVRSNQLLQQAKEHFLKFFSND